MKAIVLAAGRGTRMGPLTERRPKVLLPVLGEPMLARLLRQLAAAGVTHATVVVNAFEEQVRAVVGDGSRFGLHAECRLQATPRGSGDAVLAGAPPEDEPYVIANGDVLLDDDAVARLVKSGPRSLTVFPVDDPRAYGVFRTDDEDRAVEVVEKSDTPPGNLANAGLYHAPAGFTRHLRALEPSPRGELELTDALNASFREDGAYACVTPAHWFDLGRPWDLLAATATLLDGAVDDVRGTVEPGATVKGALILGEGAVVKAGTYIEGPVFIGKNCTVGPNAYLRPFTVLEDGAKVGNAVEVKASILMERATVGHLSYVGDSILGARVNFGAGTKVANLRHDGKNVIVRWKGKKLDTGRRKFGVVIGDDVHTGINTSLNVGVMLPAGAGTRPGDVVLRTPDAE